MIPESVLRERFTVTREVTLRVCRGDDLPALEWFGLFTAHREIIRSVYDSQESGEAIMLVAEVQGFPIGQVWIDLIRKSVDATGVLWAVRVFPILQNLGIGTRLMAAAEEVLRYHAQARAWTGSLPEGVIWHDATDEMPSLLTAHFDPALAEGAGWKFAPLRFFPDRYELSLDNNCILWAMPVAIQRWLTETEAQTCVVAEDVLACFGQFASLCGPEPRNGGIRGLPPAFDFEMALCQILAEHPVLLTSELDEQGLQTAALARFGTPLVVTIDEVTICSPFPPHLPGLGRCGAHFCGLNAKQLPWSLEGRPAVDYIKDHWLRLRGAVYEKIAPP